MSNVRVVDPEFLRLFSWEQQQPKAAPLKSIPRNRAYFLSEAKRLLDVDRQDDYGDAEDTHNRIAAMWTALFFGPEPVTADEQFGWEPFNASEVALAMACVKLVRAVKTPRKADSYVDGAAYFALAGEFARAT